MLAAWKEIEAAQQIQSDHTYYWHHLRPAWSAPVLGNAQSALEALETRNSPTTDAPPEPSKPHGAALLLAVLAMTWSCATALAPALRDAAGHFGTALTHLQAAMPLVPDDAHSTLDHWYQPELGASARLTPRQVLGEQLTAVRLQEQCQRRMSRFFQALGAGENPAARRDART